ncbi:MAG TPA: type II toxin-antitoxin system ParD family antitoxin [Methylocystis sp.]|nr:type II toxin-antitoxin system ParD family antitoxin [Methylocystis sp.]
MNVTLPPELERFVQDKIRSGLFGSESEVVRAALRLMEDQDRPVLWGNDDIRAKIDAGLASLKAGKGVDGEAVFDRLEAEMDEDEARGGS